MTMGATEQVKDKPVPKAVSKYMAEKGALGGAARAKNMTSRQLRTQARNAANKRWSREGENE